MSSFLEGKKIYLRPLLRSDIHKWFKWFNDLFVTEHMNKGSFPNTKGQQEEYLRSLAKSRNDLQLAIVTKVGRTLIGIVGIHKIDWIHRRAEISIVIGDKKYWGKGLAKEAVALMVRHAFTKMNLHRLSAGMFVLNTGSRKCFVENGFQLEGAKRKSFFYQGKYMDEYMLGLLREEWKGA